MSLKVRLSVMNFIQFFIFGSWLITLSAYASKVLHFSGEQIGAVYGTIGIASLFMPTLAGCIADRWFNIERVYSVCHFIGAIMLVASSFVTTPVSLFWTFLVYTMCYMPTIPLASALCFRIISDSKEDIVKVYPPVRVWGTIGFICALWTISLAGFELSAKQLYVAGISSLILSIYALTLPKCPPVSSNDSSSSLISKLGLDAFSLFKNPRMALFFVFSILIGVLLQVNNTYVAMFLHDFDINPLYKNAFGVTHSAILMSLSQLSETVFILAIPFFMSKFGIKKIMLISVGAWVIRFGLLAYGDPGHGIWLILLSMIVFGCAFDFFNISCSIFVDQETPSHMRAGAQGIFFIMTLGFGAFTGAYGGGLVIDAMSSFINGEIIRNWHSIWITFASYSLIIGVLFALFFKTKHNAQPSKLQHH